MNESPFTPLASTIPDVSQSNLEKLKALFPHLVTESADGLAVDWVLMRQEFAQSLVEGEKERYRLEWPGKREALFTANRPTTTTLRPDRESSKAFDSTQNLYIEGDNLEALKLLRQSYLGKVKMIYIDPPYNTGHDFVYNDDFATKKTEELTKSGTLDAEGHRTISQDAMKENTESNGRYHSDWLTMMYPRLKLARDLLADDGVIFISIDDNEQTNLKKLCDEIFGEECFVTAIHCQLSTTQGMKVKAAQGGNIVKNAEYILCYSRDGHQNIAKTPLYDLREKYDEHYSLYLKEDGTIGQLRELYDYSFPKDCNNKKPYKLAEAYQKSQEFADIVRSHLADIVRSDKVTFVGADLQQGRWRSVEHNGRKYLLTLDTNGNVRQLLRLADSWGKTDGFYGEEGLRKIRGDWWAGFYIDMGNVAKEGSIDFKNGKKPVRLLLQLAKMVTDKSSLILDFFSGSATTAHAVMQLNAEDGGNRKFILVQLPEVCDEKSEAYKAGYKTICEIGKERIRRAGAQIQASCEAEEKAVPDVGFRVLKVDSSNLVEAKRKPEETTVEDLFEGTIKAGRTEEDLLFQAIRETGGLPLTCKIERQAVDGVAVWVVDGGNLVACLAERGITAAVASTMAEMMPAVAVFREDGFANDTVKANVVQQFVQRGCTASLRVI